MPETEETMRVLNLVAEAKISPEEGAKLLTALEQASSPRIQPAPNEPTAPRWFRVRVTDLATGKTKVNVNLPTSLVEVAIRMGARFAPDLEGVNYGDIVEQVKGGAQGKIIEVEDVERSERIEIHVD